MTRRYEDQEQEFTINKESVKVMLEVSKLLFEDIPTEKQIINTLADMNRSRFKVIEGGKANGEKTSSL